MVSNKIAPVLLDICKISLNTKSQRNNAKQIKAIAYQLNQWKLKSDRYSRFWSHRNEVVVEVRTVGGGGGRSLDSVTEGKEAGIFILLGQWVSCRKSLSEIEN